MARSPNYQIDFNKILKTWKLCLLKQLKEKKKRNPYLWWRFWLVSKRILVWFGTTNVPVLLLLSVITTVPRRYSLPEYILLAKIQTILEHYTRLFFLFWWTFVKEPQQQQKRTSSAISEHTNMNIVGITAMSWKQFSYRLRSPELQTNNCQIAISVTLQKLFSYLET